MQPKMLDPDTDEMNADPQPWSQQYCSVMKNIQKINKGSLT
jgi:hypothetical protein